MTKELWKVIPNTNDRYYISSFGRVYSTYGKGKLMKQCVRYNKGYLVVRIRYIDSIKSVYVHRLVAEAFIHNIDTTRNTVNHIDGDKYNNNVNNLEWLTREENVEHSLKEGLHAKPRRAIYCVELNKIYPSLIAVSRDLNINPSTVYWLCNGGKSRVTKYSFRYLEEVE